MDQVQWSTFYQTFRKEPQGGDKSNIRVSRSVKGNMMLIFLENAGCLADHENPEMSLVDSERPEFHMVLGPGPQNPSKNVFL